MRFVIEGYRMVALITLFYLMVVAGLLALAGMFWLIILATEWVAQNYGQAAGMVTWVLCGIHFIILPLLWVAQREER